MPALAGDCGWPCPSAESAIKGKLPVWGGSPLGRTDPHQTGARNECRGLGDSDFGDRGGGRGGSGASSIFAWSMRIRCSTKRTTCGPACHSCANFGMHRPKLRGSDGPGHAPALRSDKGQRSCRGLCDGQELSGHILALDPFKRPAPLSSCPIGRSLSTTTRAANTVRAIKLVEPKTTPRRYGAYRGRN